MYINKETNLYPLSESDIRNAFPNVSFPLPFVAPEPYTWVFPSPVPEYNLISQFVREIAPKQTTLGHWEQQWEVAQLNAEDITANQAAEAAAEARRLANKIDALWTAADAYVSGYISGVAIGILTIGVIQSKPKAMAIAAWSSSVWAAYYERKAAIGEFTAESLNFSNLGPMPYSVPELQAEVGV